MSGVDAASFKAALGRLAAGVTVVTVADGATVTHDEIFPAGEEPSAEAPADEETATP